MCTYRPSLSSQEEISRNKVGVPEGAPRKIIKIELESKAAHLHWAHIRAIRVILKY